MGLENDDKKEDRVFKGIRFTHLSIFISAGILLCAIIGVGSKIISATTDVLVELKLNTTCTSKASEDIKELKTTEKNDYVDLSSRIDKKQDKNYRYLFSIDDR